MADHHAERIMDAFVALLDPLTTTEGNIQRDRPYDVEISVDYALSVYQGKDTPSDESPWPFIDSYLEIYLDLFVRESSEVALSQTLNKIRNEVVVAIMADYTLALSFVHEVKEDEAGEPVIERGDKPTAQQRTVWVAKYRRSITDPSA